MFSNKASLASQLGLTQSCLGSAAVSNRPWPFHDGPDTMHRPRSGKKQLRDGQWSSKQIARSTDPTHILQLCNRTG